VQYYTEARTLFLIKKTCFRPSPKVDSSLLRLEIREMPLVKTNNERLLFKIIRAAFNKRRKTLRNSLKGVIGQEKLKLFFKRYSINADTRPEELSLVDFANLNNI
jgi:16S rRNA (adenine1518-N6/adenine1519-N6)-dimethyltransferase